MCKDEEERQKLQHAKDRIDEYIAKQGDDHTSHKQEGKNNKDGGKQTVLEDKDVHKSEVLSGKRSEEGRRSAATSSINAWADADF